MRVGRVIAVAILVGSAAITAAAGATWHRSYHGGDQLQINLARVGVGSLSTTSGVRMAMGIAKPPARTDEKERWFWKPTPMTIDPRSYGRGSSVHLDVAMDSGPDPVGGRWYALIVPDWTRVFIATLPGVAAARRLRRRSASPTRGRACGYDLRATPERCPGCGTTGPLVP